jgi:hypothetical protein
MTQPPVGTVFLDGCRGEIVDERVDEGFEIGGVHGDTGFHRRCAQRTIRQYGSTGREGPSNVAATGVASEAHRVVLGATSHSNLYSTLRSKIQARKGYFRRRLA